MPQAKWFNVGDSVRVTGAKSVAHLTAGGYSTAGVIARVVEASERDRTKRNAEAPVPLSMRAYMVTFDDRPGEWAYAGYELERASG